MFYLFYLLQHYEQTLHQQESQIGIASRYEFSGSYKENHGSDNYFGNTVQLI